MPMAGFTRVIPLFPLKENSQNSTENPHGYKSTNRSFVQPELEWDLKLNTVMWWRDTDFTKTKVTGWKIIELFNEIPLNLL